MVVGKILGHEFAVARDDHEQVVEVVRHPACELADCLEALSLAQLPFQAATGLLALGLLGHCLVKLCVLLLEIADQPECGIPSAPGPLDDKGYEDPGHDHHHQEDPWEEVRQASKEGFTRTYDKE